MCGDVRGRGLGAPSYSIPAGRVPPGDAAPASPAVGKRPIGDQSDKIFCNRPLARKTCYITHEGGTVLLRVRTGKAGVGPCPFGWVSKMLAGKRGRWQSLEIPGPGQRFMPPFRRTRAP